MSNFFFTQPDQPLGQIVAPSVYRIYPGSSTIIVTQVKEDYVEYIPMDAEGLDVKRSTIHDFRANYVRMPYEPALAAENYLKAAHIACSDRARYILGQIAQGKEFDMATDPVSAELSKKRAAKKRAKADEIADSAAKHKQASDAKKASAKKVAKKTAKGASTKPAKEKKEGAGRGRGIGAFVKEKISAGLEADKIVELVQAKFPGAKTNNAHISWYRARMREAGELKE